MPNIKDKSTVEAIAREFCSNGRNKLKALKTVGYQPSYYNTLGIGKVYSNIRVIDAIARIDAKTEAKLEHNRDIAVKLLNENLSYLTNRVEQGDVGAIQARTSVIRELDAISNLHSSTVHTEPEQPNALTDTDIDELKAIAARATTIKLRKGPDVDSKAQTG